MKRYTPPIVEPRIRIALIDSCAAIRCAMPRLLADRGYDVVVHARASGAVSFVRRQRPAVVFLELHLEREESGLPVMQALQREPETASIPLIMWSIDPELERKVAASGARGVLVLSKQTRLGALLKVLRELTGTAPVGASSLLACRSMLGIAQPDAVAVS